MKFKSIITTVSAISILSLLTPTTFANELPDKQNVSHTTNVNNSVKPSSVQVGMVKVVNQKSNTNNKTSKTTISPNATSYGDGGIAKLNYSGQSLTWSVKPNTDWPWYFKGSIVITDASGNVSATIPISTEGAFGSTDGGTVSVSKYPGGHIAILTGTAYELNGSTDTVLPGCSIWFYF